MSLPDPGRGDEVGRNFPDAGDGDAALRQAETGVLSDVLRRARDAVTFPTEPMPEGQLPMRLGDEGAGDVVGNFRLVEMLGEGGFGSVWLAEQDKPVRRSVALKIIKLGMDTRDVIARFERERQALAVMDHPNIARVLDAGATPSGRPFFVMELVRGVRITDYCDQNKLPLQERLKLFITVCQAVQHAHQKGIIHRDLKPSNIMVTVHDGMPAPKVIDFGVAKATQQQLLTDTSLVTQFEVMIGTPSYMSPEQASGDLDIDTRSDIYSLGVLLYEMLTGRTPFDPKVLARSGLDEMRRIIREQEPRRPSAMLESLSADELNETALTRRADAMSVLRGVRGDLDWIVMKAMEKDRARRYESATTFADDIARNLRFEPVTARPPSRIYRFRRLVRRNKFVFLATGAVAAALVMGLGLSTWMLVREREAHNRAVAAEKEQGRLRAIAQADEKKAQAEALKSQQVATFLGDMLESVGPSVARGRDTALLREILDKAALRIGNDLRTQPDVATQLRMTIGNVYRDVGRLDVAEQMLREVLTAQQRQFGAASREVALACNNLANVLTDEHKLAESEGLHRQALELNRKLLGDENPQIARSYNNLANVLAEEGKLVDAEAMLRKAWAMFQKLPGDNNREVFTAEFNLASILAREDKFAEAEVHLRDVLEKQRKQFGSVHPDVAKTLANLAMILGNHGKLAEAEQLSGESVQLHRKLYGSEHPAVATALYNLGQIQRAEQRPADAEKSHRDALDMRRKLLGSDHPDVARSLNSLASILSSVGKLPEAEKTYREELDVLRKSAGEGSPDFASCRRGLAEVLRHEDKNAEADALLAGTQSK